MKFGQYVYTLAGRNVIIHVKHMSDFPREDGAKWTIAGRLVALGEDFILVQGEANYPPAALRIKDIVTIEEDIDEDNECEECGGDEHMDHDRVLWEWEREQDRLGG